MPDPAAGATRLVRPHEDGDGTMFVTSLYRTVGEALAQAAEDYAAGMRQMSIMDAGGAVIYGEDEIEKAGKKRVSEIQAERKRLLAGG